MKEHKAKRGGSNNINNNNNNNNFEDGEDADWPDLDVGNLIIGLDKDLNQSDRPREAGMSGKTKSAPPTKEPEDKAGVKMKLKRSKSSSKEGSSREPESARGAEANGVAGEAEEGVERAAVNGAVGLGGGGHDDKDSSPPPPPPVGSQPVAAPSLACPNGQVALSTAPTPTPAAPTTTTSSSSSSSYSSPVSAQLGPRYSMYGGSALREALEQPPLNRFKVMKYALWNAAKVKSFDNSSSD